MFTMPLEEPTATHLSPPRWWSRPLSPPRLSTVVPTAPSSFQRATTLFCRASHSLISPFLPATLMPSPSRHHAKSATPPRLSMRTCATHCEVVASSTLMTPPPLRLVPCKPIQRPQGEILNFSMLFWSSLWPCTRDTLAMSPVSRSQMWK